MDEVAELVVGKYDGSLKAEHGTGRNMAPFVEMEWGSDAYALMQRIKALFGLGQDCGRQWVFRVALSAGSHG